MAVKYQFDQISQFFFAKVVKFKNLWQLFEGFIKLLAILNLHLQLGKFYSCKSPNIEKVILQSGHTVKHLMEY